MTQLNLGYRKCVVAVIKNDRNLFLVGERRDVAGAWQFPQGGIDGQESPRDAILRELKEEIGSDKVTVLREGDRWVSYDFPEALDHNIARKYRGQSQKWFLLTFQPGHYPDLTQSDGEFRDLTWKPLEEIVAGIVSWKRQAYLEGLRILDLDAKGG